MTNLLFIVLSLLMAITSHSQKSTTFLGEWKVEASNHKGEWILKRPVDTTEFRSWGMFFHFNHDGTYTQKASATCGLDDNHFYYTGKWKYKEITKTIELTEIKVIHHRPNVYQDYKVLTSGSIQVISFQDNLLKIRVVKNWEKVSKKKM